MNPTPQENKTWQEQFEEKFPVEQKEPTHFDDCVCWGCNNYREKVKEFISQVVSQTRQDTLRESLDLLIKLPDTYEEDESAVFRTTKKECIDLLSNLQKK